MEKPDLKRIVDTFVPMREGYFEQLRQDVVPFIRNLQGQGKLRWYSFLIHGADQLDGRANDVGIPYIHLRLEPMPGVDLADFISQLPDHFEKPIPVVLEGIGKNDYSMFGILEQHGITVVTIIFSSLVGYLFATAKFSREEKQKAYGELLASIVRMIYDPASADEADAKEFNKSLMKLWFYGSKRAARKMEQAVKIFHHRNKYEKGTVTTALQKAIVEIRKDTQVWPWQRVKPNEVVHLYTIFLKPKSEDDHR